MHEYTGRALWVEYIVWKLLSRRIIKQTNLGVFIISDFLDANQGKNSVEAEREENIVFAAFSDFLSHKNEARVGTSSLNRGQLQTQHEAKKIPDNKSLL